MCPLQAFLEIRTPEYSSTREIAGFHNHRAPKVSSTQVRIAVKPFPFEFAERAVFLSLTASFPSKGILFRRKAYE